MKIFFIFGKSSAKELEEIRFKYRAEVLSVVKSFGGDVKDMYAMVREKYLFCIFTFPGIKRAKEASLALSKLTGISLRILPAVPVNDLSRKWPEVLPESLSIGGLNSG
jgi:uncharacterized protein with GYD domain